MRKILKTIRNTAVICTVMFYFAASGALADNRNVDEIRKIASDGLLKGAVVGILIQDLDTGKVLLKINENRVFIPASNMKLITAGAAILALGPRYRFYTDFFAKGFDGASGKAGGLYVKGYGDPTMKDEFYEENATEGADEIARRIVRSGLKKVSGVLWLDDTFFAGSDRPDSWEEDDLEWCYAPRPGALSAGGNCLKMEIRGDTTPGRPANIEFDPVPDISLIRNNVESVSKGATEI